MHFIINFKFQKMEKTQLKTFIKGQAALKQTNMTKIADRLGKRQSSMSIMLSQGTMSVSSLIEILDVLGEELVIELKNGNKFKIEI